MHSTRSRVHQGNSLGAAMTPGDLLLRPRLEHACISLRLRHCGGRSGSVVPQPETTQWGHPLHCDDTEPCDFRGRCTRSAWVLGMGVAMNPSVLRPDGDMPSLHEPGPA